MRRWLAGIGLGALLACAPAADATTVFTQTPQSPYAGSGATPTGAFAQGDFNGDGKLDFFEPDSDGSYRVFLGQGDGTFQPVPASGPFPTTGGTTPFLATVGRFNGDTLDDVAITHLNSAGVTVLLATGGGAFRAATGSPFGAGNGNGRGIASGDLNGDGHLDVAWVDASSNLDELLGDGNGGFTAGPGPYAVSGTLPAIGRIDAGPTPDVAMDAYPPAGVAVLLNDGTGRLAPAPGSPYPTSTRYPSGPVVGDMNGDGLGDVLVAHASNVDNVVSVLLGSASGALTAMAGSPFPSGEIGPFTTFPPTPIGSDPFPDVVETGTQSNQIAVLQGDGTGRLGLMEGTPFAAATEPEQSAVGDYNGDGIPDIAYVVANAGNSLYVLLGRRAAIADRTDLAFPATAVGGASGSASVRVTNTAAFAISFGGASIDGADGGDFVRGADSCSGQTLAAGASCDVAVRFLPSAAGARSATLTLAQDGDLLRIPLAGTGASPGGGAGGGGGTTPLPTLTAFGLSNRTFAVSGGRAPHGRHAPKRGTRFHATVAHALRLVIALERSEPGRRVGGRCVAPTRAHRRARHCTRRVQAGTLVYAVRDGANSLSWSGRVGRRAAKPGSYRAVATARANGRTSKPRSVTFRIVKG